jgi:stearoyl-CoA desaturase (delta-9 desaturase)
LLQHVTWSVNSLCHVVGARPFTTRRHDRATNLRPLALLSLGESWHNMHHSDPPASVMAPIPGRSKSPLPSSASSSAWAGATSVHWPARARLESRRRDQGQHQPAPVRQTAGR